MKAVVPDSDWQEVVVIIDTLIIHFVVHSSFYLNSSITFLSWQEKESARQFINVWRIGV